MILIVKSFSHSGEVLEPVQPHSFSRNEEDEISHKEMTSSREESSAFDLLKKYPNLVTENEDKGSILEELAYKPLAFERIPVQEEHIHYPTTVLGDKESQIETSKRFKKFTYFGSISRQISTVSAALCQKFHILLWNALINLVPGIKYISDIKLMHIQTLEVVRMMCHEGVILSNAEASKSLAAPILTATRFGICEIAVESYVHSSFQDQKNSSNKTPSEVFTEEHKDLVKEGEKWMKDTASSCTVVAALIIKVVFAAAFTVPGSKNNDGIPNVLHIIPFIVFAISDALALFSSTALVLMFLGILTSRYSEDGFLESLPKKLMVGLMNLFFSIASMMVAFGATYYTVLSNPWKWVIIPIASLGCLPVMLFAWMQFPLLVNIFISTYRPTIALTAIKQLRMYFIFRS